MAPCADESRWAIPRTLSSFSALGIVSSQMENAPAAQHARAHVCLGRCPSLGEADAAGLSLALGITLFAPAVCGVTQDTGYAAGAPSLRRAATNQLCRGQLDVLDASGVGPDARTH